jgi:transaldolase
MGRVDDIAVDATAVLAEIVDALRDSEAQVLAASLRHPMHAVTAATLGCDVSTIPSKVLKQMLVHPLTAAGIEKFATDWQSDPRFAEWLGGLVEGAGARA